MYIRGIYIYIYIYIDIMRLFVNKHVARTSDQGVKI